MRKAFFSIVLIALVICGIVLVSNFQVNPVKAVTNVTGIIISDTIWTPASSPYSLTGPTAVAVNVTLTIEAGTTINFNSYYIQVNGTLSARGAVENPVYFNGGEVRFTTLSKNWNEDTASGCLFENVVLNSSKINGQGSPKIFHSNFINGAEISLRGSAKITFNTFTDSGVFGDSALVINNTVFNGGIKIGDTASFLTAVGAGTVCNNTLVNGGITAEGGISERYSLVANNTIINPEGTGISSSGYANISDNCIRNCKIGINLYGAATLGGSLPCTELVEKNLITNCSRGINIVLYSRFDPETRCPVIINNSILLSTIGIYLSNAWLYQAAPTFQGNNIENSKDFSFYNENLRFNTSATCNWWGTTNSTFIGERIYDFKNDFTLGTVTYDPFLTSPNPLTPTHDFNPNPSPLPTPAPIPSQAPTPSPTIAPISTPSPAPTVAPTLAPTFAPTQTSNLEPTATTSQTITPISTPSETPQPTQDQTPTPTASDLPSPSFTNSPNAEPSPTIPEFETFITLPILMATVMAGLIICKKNLGKIVE